MNVELELTAAGMTHPDAATHSEVLPIFAHGKRGGKELFSVRINRIGPDGPLDLGVLAAFAVTAVHVENVHVARPHHQDLAALFNGWVNEWNELVDCSCLSSPTPIHPFRTWDIAMDVPQFR